MTTRFHLIRRSLVTALMFAGAATGCTTDAIEEMDEVIPPDDQAPSDVTPPAVASTAPANNAVGVRADAKILVTFSEQMDPVTVAAAYSSSELPADTIEMFWNDTGTVLEIRPIAGLEYETGLGTDPWGAPTKSYQFAIGIGAKDIAGNPLEDPLEVTFATKKYMIASIPLSPSLSRVIRDTTVLSAANPMWIGDNDSLETYRSYLAFDLSAMAEDIEIQAAELSATQEAPSGMPYAMGAVAVQHVSYAGLDAAVGAQTISLPGTLSEDPVLDTKRLDVTLQVADDYEKRAERNSYSQYRLQIDPATNNNDVSDTAVFTRSSFQLQVIYLAD